MGGGGGAERGEGIGGLATGTFCGDGVMSGRGLEPPCSPATEGMGSSSLSTIGESLSTCSADLIFLPFLRFLAAVGLAGVFFCAAAGARAEGTAFAAADLALERSVRGLGSGALEAMRKLLDKRR